ncbi:MAG: hypothetical protein K5945_02060 [Bacteroidaceae bacterium]|nr:hypothetical protein [Bacteroidaceae bacterium]
MNICVNHSSALPVCIVLSSIMWWMGGSASPLDFAGWAVCILVTYTLAEMDNAQQLIRIRSRLLPCVWLFVASATPALHPLFAVQLPAFCLATSHHLLLRCYQRSQPVGHVFHCFLLLALGSLLFPPMLLLALPMLCYLWRLMTALTWRTFSAAMLGTALPYVLWGCWCLLSDCYTPFLLHFHPFLRSPWAEADISAYLHSALLFPFALITLLTLLSTLHHLLTPFSDKIRVRLMLRVFIFQSILCFAMFFALPASQPAATALLLVSSAPLIAHFFALTRNKFTNILFLVALLAFVAQMVWSVVNR